jgi:pyruvate dehydrogenase E1 component alpha subunit
LINIAREKKIPVFIEAITYRHFGHVDWREDIDVGIYRSPKDLKTWKLRDPILRLESALFKANLLTEDELLKIKTGIDNQIDLAWKQALEDLEPKYNSMLGFVYRD